MNFVMPMHRNVNNHYIGYLVNQSTRLQEIGLLGSASGHCAYPAQRESCEMALATCISRRCSLQSHASSEDLVSYRHCLESHGQGLVHTTLTPKALSVWVAFILLSQRLEALSLFVSLALASASSKTSLISGRSFAWVAGVLFF